MISIDPFIGSLNLPHLLLYCPCFSCVPYPQIAVDGVNFLSAIEAAQFRASRNGCGTKGEMAGPVVSDAQMQCTDFCGKKAGAPPAKLCGMTQVLHDTGKRVATLTPIVTITLND
jgi:hypothetical protein